MYETLTERSNVIVIADEAHRTQYGFKAKTVEVKNEADEVIGSEIKYGLPSIFVMPCPMLLI